MAFPGWDDAPFDDRPRPPCIICGKWPALNTGNECRLCRGTTAAKERDRLYREEEERKKAEKAAIRQFVRERRAEREKRRKAIANLTPEQIDALAGDGVLRPASGKPLTVEERTIDL